MTTIEKTRTIENLRTQRTVAESKGDARRVMFLTKSIQKWTNRPSI